EITERIGQYPKGEAEILLVEHIKMFAKRERIESIQEKGNTMELLLEEDRSQKVDGTKLFELAVEAGNNVQLGTVGKKLIVKIKFNKESMTERYTFVGDFIDQLANVNQTEENISVSN